LVVAVIRSRTDVSAADGAGILTWFERKVVAHIQSRWGPYRAARTGCCSRWPMG